MWNNLKKLDLVCPRFKESSKLSGPIFLAGEEKKSIQPLIFLSVPCKDGVQRLLGVFIRSFYFNHPPLGLPGDAADIS